MYSRAYDALSGDVHDGMVLRDDGAHIPADPLNAGWQAYEAWLAAGNRPAETSPSLVSPPASASFTGHQWALAVGDLGLAPALLAALAASKAKDRHRYGFIGRDTRLRPDDPLLSRICAQGSAQGGAALDLGAIAAHARTMPT